MARSKATTTEATEPDAVTEQVGHVEQAAEAVPADRIDEQRAAFLAHLDRMLSIDGRLQAVQCDLPGYTGITVHYNVDNTYGIARLLSEMPKGMDDHAHFRLWSLFIRRFEGQPDGVPADRPVEWPTPSDPDSYALLWDNMYSFAMWCRFEGYTRAKKLALGNS